jgi:hypothetical protein
MELRLLPELFLFLREDAGADAAVSDAAGVDDREWEEPAARVEKVLREKWARGDTPGRRQGWRECRPLLGWSQSATTICEVHYLRQ